MFLGTEVIQLLKLYLSPVSNGKISCFKYSLREFKLTFHWHPVHSVNLMEALSNLSLTFQ